MNNYFPRENINFKELSIRPILQRLYKVYKLDKNIIDIINVIFHLKDDINIPENILDDIYQLDNNRDLYLEKTITLEELTKDLETFFYKNI